ncbi:MAG: glutathione S-transferase C-terminal domain-containing protein [Pseudomonadota bacterium]
MDKESLDAVKAAAEKLVAARLDLIEAELAQGDWFVGSGPTIVAPYAVPMLRWVKFATSHDLSKYSGVL